MKYRIYDGFACAEGSNDITASSNDVNGGTVYLLTSGIQSNINTTYNSNPLTSGSGMRDMFLHLTIQPSTISSSPIYTEEKVNKQLFALVNFCVRFSLYNDDANLASAIEVNFQETLISFRADLTDGFNLDNNGITVVPKDKTTQTANIACEVIGYECTLDNKPLANPGYLRYVMTRMSFWRYCEVQVH